MEPLIFFPKFQFSLHSWASLVDQFTFSTFFFEFFFHQQFTNFQIILFSDESMDILKLLITQPSIVGTHFLWHNKIKSLSSFIVGSSPEFDLAMYTACFFARRDVDCRFSMAGHSMDIKSYTVPFGTYHDLVATAYIN